MDNNFEIILFYKYINIEDPTALMDSQRALCQELDLKGRIIVAKEGINATLEGTKENIDSYLLMFLSDERFKDTHIKRSPGTGDAFPKLSVKVRDEIVSSHLGEKDVNPNETTGNYLMPEELHEWFESGKEFYIVDMRNNYEHNVGHFEGSIMPALENFRDLSKVVEEIADLKGKTILTVCTGGVRCEKASGFLVKNGFANVYQLYGGIVSYMEKYPNRNFLGKLYVFDKRILMGFNTDSPEHVVVGKCAVCGNASENYTNCTWNGCHKHFICCDECYYDEKPFCSENCKKSYQSESVMSESLNLS